MTGPVTHPLQYMTVTGRLGAILADGLDLDDLPDQSALRANVLFTYLIGPGDSVLLPHHPDGPRTMLVKTVLASLDMQGRVSYRGKPWVKLWCPDEWTNPTEGAYRVDFSEVTIDGRPVTLRSIQIPALPGSEVDLTDVWAVPGTPPPGITRGERGVSIDGWTVTGDTIVLELDNGESLPPKTFPALTTAIAAAGEAGQARDDVQDIHDNIYGTAVPQMQQLLTDTTTAKTDAVTAKGQAETARDLAEQYRDQAANYVGGVADNAISTVKIQDDAVTLAKLAATVRASITKADSALQSAPVVSVNGATGAVVLAKANLGLGNVDNTADLAKPVSTAVQAALNGKVSAGSQFYDPVIVILGKGTVRAVGANDFLYGLRLRRAVTVDSVMVRGATNGVSGTTVVQVLKNGSATGMTSVSCSEGSYVTGAENTGSWVFAAGDIISVSITSVGTSPGKGLIVELRGSA